MQMNKAILRNSEIVIFDKKNNFAAARLSFFQTTGLETFFFTSALCLFICMDKSFDW